MTFTHTTHKNTHTHAMATTKTPNGVKMKRTSLLMVVAGSRRRAAKPKPSVLLAETKAQTKTAEFVGRSLELLSLPLLRLCDSQFSWARVCVLISIVCTGIVCTPYTVPIVFLRHSEGSQSSNNHIISLNCWTYYCFIAYNTMPDPKPSVPYKFDVEEAFCSAPSSYIHFTFSISK